MHITALSVSVVHYGHLSIAIQIMVRRPDFEETDLEQDQPGKLSSCY